MKHLFTCISLCLLFQVGIGQRISGESKQAASNSSSRTLDILPQGLIFYEGFDNIIVPNLPSSWTTYSAGDDGFETGTAGNLVGQANENGFWPVPYHGLFALTNDDVCNCDKSFDLLISKSFNLLANDYVRIGFSAFQNGSGGQTAELQVKSSSSSWVSLFSIPASSAWEEYSLNIPSEFLHADAQFRFRYNDQGNYGSGLAVDDIYLSTSPEGSFKMDAFYTIDGAKAASGYLPRFIPRTQARYAHLAFGAEVSNASDQVKNARLAVNINGPLDHSDTSSDWSLPALTLDTISTPIRNVFTPYDSGYYELEARILTDSSDNSELDNAFNVAFTVNDSVYQRFNEMSDGTGIWMLDTFDRTGSVFEIFTKDSVISSWIHIHPTTEEGARFRIKIFDFNSLGASIFSTSPVQVSSADIGQPLRVEIGKSLDPGKYLVVVEHELKRLVISTSASEPSPRGVSFYQSYGGIWDHLAYTPFMNLILGQVDDNCPGHIQAQIQDETCPQQEDGAIKIEGLEMNLIPTYSWSNGAGNVDSISSLEPGAYEVFATNANGCIYNRVFEIGASDPIFLASDITLDSCAKGVGSIELNPKGSHAPFSLTWQGSFTTNKVSGLSQGLYNVGVTSDQGCTLDTAVVIEGSAALAVAVGVTSPGCNATNGTLTANGIGSGPFLYAWSTNDSTEIVDSLPSGIYHLTISDSLGCTAQVAAILNDSNAPSINSFSTQDNLCAGDALGSISVQATGQSSLSFAWSNSQNNNEITNLTSGRYLLTISDTSNCKSFGAYEIEDEAAPFSINMMEVGVLCHGVNAGSLEVLTNGGQAPFEYAWNPTQNGESRLENLASGTYAVTVTDDNNCSHSFESLITSQPEFFYNVDSLRTDTNGVSKLDGYIYLSTFGGTPPYFYSWNNGAETEDLVGIDTGWYELEIKDQLGCIQNFEKYLSDDPLKVNAPVSINSITAYPNPTLAHIGFSVEGQENIVRLIAIPMNGSLAFELPQGPDGKYRIYESGIYVLKMTDNQHNVYFTKVIVL